MSNSRAASAAPQPHNLKVTDYLVGPQLDDALAAGQEITVSWPFVDGQINDFMQAEALWYVVFHFFKKKKKRIIPLAP
jgi:actin-related protein 9